jgi:hypothetical protein
LTSDRLEAAVGVGVGNDRAALDNRGNDRSASGSSKLTELGQAVSLVVKVLVDDTDHAALAVVALGLGAVVPDGLAVVEDHGLEDIVGLALGGHKVEAGEEAKAVGRRRAGSVEVGLGDGVVGGEEVPLHDIANIGDDVVGVEAEAAEAGNDRVSDSGELNSVVGIVAGGLCGRSGDAGGEEESSGESLEGEHLEGWDCDCGNLVAL